MKRLGVDVGGTFIDLIYVDDESGDILVLKQPSTPDDLASGTTAGIEELSRSAGVSPDALDQIFHGTTIATNIVIEHNGALVGMLTTEGYRDILHIARHKKPLNFSNYQDLPWQRYPLVRRRFRLVVPERITKGGEVLTPLDENKVREQALVLKEARVDAIAICFLFSFLNPTHELRAAAIMREVMPEAFISASCEVLPQYREYERFSTVCLNAYVGPKVAEYLGRLELALEELGVKTGVHVMTSTSGVATAAAAAKQPVNLLMSGPVAGVVGGIWAGKNAGFSNVITLDIGGTSADIGLARDGELRMKHLLDTKVGAYQAMVPMVDVDTIGAGGGSIAYVDQGGIFRVGPRSAGAVPGPVAYDRGGLEPTATDALLNLGWLLPDALLGGGMSLRDDLARNAFLEGPASALDMSVEEASMGAVRILIHSLVQAIEENSVRKGYDPRDFALVAAGGAGPVFAAHVALEIGTPWVVIPPFPGITSAMGLLATDMVYEYGSTSFQRLSTIDAPGLQAQFEALEANALSQLQADGVADDRVILQRIADCRYVGQGYELRVAAPSGQVDASWVDALRSTFHDAHEREYSTRSEARDIEIPNVRVRGIGLMPELKVPSTEPGTANSSPAPCGESKAWFLADAHLAALRTLHYQRDALRPGHCLEGPALIRQYDSTTIIPPGLAGEVDASANIVIATGRAAAVTSGNSIRAEGARWISS